MIAPQTRFRVARVPLARIVFTMQEPRYEARLLAYLQRLRDDDDCDVLVHLAPLEHGYYRVLDGHHRTLAALAAGRSHVHALIIYEPCDPDYPMAETPQLME